MQETERSRRLAKDPNAALFIVLYDFILLVLIAAAKEKIPFDGSSEGNRGNPPDYAV
jgi:hypothetical protein